MNRILLKTAVGLCLFVALIICGIWAFTGAELEPWVTLLALVAVILGLIIDPWLANRSSRRGLLRDLAHEIMFNLNIMNDEKFQKIDGLFVMYPRITLTVIESAISSGLFSRGKDGKLIKLLYGWYDKGSEFNNRLTMTENKTANKPPKDIKIFQERLAKGKLFTSVKTSLGELATCLMEDYKAETSIGMDTVIFGGNDKKKE